MIKTLDRQQLDVVNKTRSNIFGWRGQFTPEFVAYLLDQADEGTGLVVDPFCGSGTVLQECAARNRAAHGFEINPAAYAMSRFFTLSRLSHAERISLVDCVERLFRAVASHFVDLPLFNPWKTIADALPICLTLAERFSCGQRVSRRPWLHCSPCLRRKAAAVQISIRQFSRRLGV
jgi:hypothetical protein